MPRHLTKALPGSSFRNHNACTFSHHTGFNPDQGLTLCMNHHVELPSMAIPGMEQSPQVGTNPQSDSPQKEPEDVSPQGTTTSVMKRVKEVKRQVGEVSLALS